LWVEAIFAPKKFLVDTSLFFTSAGDPFLRQVAVPANAGSAGTVGDWAADDSWLYRCTATDTWKRTAVTFATW
jgi:hypothetical protein